MIDPHFITTGPVEFHPTAICRHGKHLIERLDSGIWVDEMGWPGCAKALIPGKSLAVTHEPMPVVPGKKDD